MTKSLAFYRANCIHGAGLLAVGGGTHVEDQMLLEERQDLVVDATVVAPGFVSPNAVVLLRFVGYSKFVQLVGKGLVGINVILIQIAAPPIKLEPAEGLRLAAYWGIMDSRKKLARTRSSSVVSIIS
jgi:hypothetical protein